MPLFMASTHTQPGKPYYFCAFYDPEGFRRFRSTGTNNAKIARTICVNIERAADLARQGKLSNEKGLKLIRETCSAISETYGKLAGDQAQKILTANVEEFVRIAGGELTTYTIRSWLDSWLAGRTDASKATVVTYRGVIDLFHDFLGARADRALATLQPSQIEEYKNHLASRVAPSTVNRAIKVCKAAFNNAVAKRQLEFNPAEHIQYIEAQESERRPFTVEEISKLLKAADTDPKLREWRTMILLGYYTGQRLRDCANLTWESVDLLNSTIRLTTMKTDRNQDIPIAEPLLRHLSTLAGDKPDAPLCPSLRGKKASWLSGQFHNLMVNAGLAEARNHQGKGKGREARREKSRISFHSLRYSTTSALKSAGVGDSVAMDIVGHDTEAMSRHYTKIPAEIKRAALSKLPDITQP
jgi:integrase